jgi:1-aminocyclopropane-1-carboxylate deaminase
MNPLTCVFTQTQPPPLQAIAPSWALAAGIELAVLRLDLVDPLISGNKSYKLAGFWQQAHAAGAAGLLSQGGAHSNHLHALAAAGQRFGFETVGLLRGEAQPTPTVQDLQAFGMQLHWLGYSGYRARHRPDFWAVWQARYPHCYPVPEGGSGLAGARGCEGLVAQVRAQLPQLGWDDYHGWWLACGTGTTLAGLVRGEAGQHEVHGALAVPESHGVREQVATLAGTQGYALLEACREGFGKVDDALLTFMQSAERECGLLLEPLYTAKALMKLRDWAQEGRFARGTRLIFVHTGGLQGRRGFAL